MKKFGVLLILLSFSIILGCSKSSDDTIPTKPIDKSANLLGTGDSANDILSNGNFTKIQVEIAFVTGFKPAEEAMNEFVAYLKRRTFKQEVELIFKELPSPNEEDLTLEEIDNLEKKNRTAYNDGETLAIYIYFADAPAEDDDEEEGLVTLGAVYRNTSMIIHEVTVRKLANLSSLISVGDVEGATLNHEFGHLFGLVNLGTDPINDHEDTEAESHCNVNGCLMRAELQFGGSGKSTTKTTDKSDMGLKSACSLSGQSVLHMLQLQSAKGSAALPALDAECILDLQGNGGK